MELSALEIAMISGCFAIAGGIVGAILTARLSYSFSVKLLKAQNKEAAAARLRAAFAPEMALMRQCLIGPDNEEVPLKILNGLHAKMPQYWHAVEEFRLYVPDEKKKAYDEAWKEYGALACTKKADIGLYFTRLDDLFAFAK